MFLRIEDLPSVLYNYQIEQITEGNTAIVLSALAAAEEECKSYFTPNHTLEFQDGRFIYDVNAIFAATGDQRHPLILQHCIVMAKYHLIILCNADIIQEHAEKRYERSIEWLEELRDGKVSLSSLPRLQVIDPTPDDDTDDVNNTPFRYGSRPKFNHE